jgi:hypothetical protein
MTEDELTLRDIAQLAIKWRTEDKTDMAEELANELPEVQIYPCVWNKA